MKMSAHQGEETVKEPLRSPLAIKADASESLRVTRERHRRGEDPFRVVQGLSQAIDGILRQIFLEAFGDAQNRVALVAVGGYGRRELCPHSDVDLLFLRDRLAPEGRIEKLVRLLWDGGFQLGHSVRSPAECFRFMADDAITASTLLENRYLIGSRPLYDRFLATAVNRYRKRHGESFAQAKIEQLRASISGEGRTIYVLEPHLKDGSCCLRDIQRVLWIENIRKQVGTFEDLERSDAFSREDVAGLRDAYGFYLRVRCELHFTAGLKLDILERDSLPEIARRLGYSEQPREAAEKLLADYFRHASSTYRFLRYYLETGTRGQRFLSKLAHKFLGGGAPPSLFVEKKVLFPRDELRDVSTGEEVMDIFLLAHREDVVLSESICDIIRRKIRASEVDLERSLSVYARLVEILRGRRNVGRVIKSLYEAGVLSRLIPEFQGLEGLVNFDGHHQFTVDEHTLRALEELDRVEAGAADVPGEFRAIFGEIESHLALRVAMLLHDIGKGMRGASHTVSGDKAAVIICERMGLDAGTTDTVKFLVYHHLKLFEVSEKRDFTEERVIESFAKLVGDEERLKMLYLLTYVDIRAVGPGTWTAWKGVQLHELYERTLRRLHTGAIEGQSIEEVLAGTRLAEDDRRRIVEHCARIGGSYALEIVPERMLDHIRLAGEFRATQEAQVDFEAFLGYSEITVCCRDRPHLFADLAGVLFAEGFNLLAARIFSSDDGLALDTFYVEVADGVRIDMGKRIHRVRDRLRRIDRKEIVVEDLIRQWVKTYRFRRMQPTGPSVYPPRVTFDNEASRECTVIDVSARDRPGLLYDLAQALSRLGLDVRTAKVSTLTDRARDSFYVVESDGAKISSAARVKEVERTLLREAQGGSSILSPKAPP
ncbi:MAG: [protein-PII] uridylyltransferase [Planctomycetes bacterium]|nr:[protein-PII] uridylyltransferase [Planctomycetota bacterium]